MVDLLVSGLGKDSLSVAHDHFRSYFGKILDNLNIQGHTFYLR